MQLYKRKIDSFRPGRTIQCRQLVATLSVSSWTAQKRFHLAELKGAKEPDNQMVIIMDPYDLINPPGEGICYSNKYLGKTLIIFVCLQEAVCSLFSRI